MREVSKYRKKFPTRFIRGENLFTSLPQLSVRGSIRSTLGKRVITSGYIAAEGREEHNDDRQGWRSTLSETYASRDSVVNEEREDDHDDQHN